MALTGATSALSSSALYQRELADYQRKADRWAKMTAGAPGPGAAAAAEAPRAPEAPPRPKKKKGKSCLQKTGAVLGKVAKVAVPTVIGFFTGGPAGAALGAVQGARGLAQKA